MPVPMGPEGLNSALSAEMILYGRGIEDYKKILSIQGFGKRRKRSSTL
jgi:hypothetical protein